MAIKTSEELFNESIEKGQEIAKKKGDRTRKMKELREQLNQAITKSTFSLKESEKQRYYADAQALKRQITALEHENA